MKLNVCHALRALFRQATAIEIGIKINLHRIIRDHIEVCVQAFRLTTLTSLTVLHTNRFVVQQKASNLKLRPDLQFIYKLLVKHKVDSSTKIELANADLSSQNSIDSERSIRDNTSPQHLKIDQLICETNLMQESDRVAENSRNEYQHSNLASHRNASTENVETSNY